MFGTDRKTHRVIVGTLRFKLPEVVTVSATSGTRITATYPTAKETSHNWWRIQALMVSVPQEKQQVFQFSI